MCFIASSMDAFLVMLHPYMPFLCRKHLLMSFLLLKFANTKLMAP